MDLNRLSKSIVSFFSILFLTANFINGQETELPFAKVHGKSFTVECKCINPEEKGNVGPFKAFWTVKIGSEIIRKGDYDYIGITMMYASYIPEFNFPGAFIRVDSLNRIYSILNYDSTPFRRTKRPFKSLVFGDIYEEQLFIDFEPYYPYYFYNQFGFDSYFFILKDVGFDSTLNEKSYTFRTVESNIWREGIAGYDNLKSTEFTVTKGYGIIQLILQRRKTELKFECNAPFWKKSKK